MNKKYILLFLFISLVMGVISYIILENIFVALGVFVVYAVLSVLLISPMFKKYDQLLKKYKECYQFENSLLIALSIKKSISSALESAVSSMPEEFVEQYNSLGHMSDKEKLEYLATYFDFADYQMFLQIVNSWDVNDGDVLIVSKYLTSNLKTNDECLAKCDELNKKKYYETAVLWVLSFSILLFVKFCLKDFYSQIKGKLTFIISFVALCLFALFSILLLAYKSTRFMIRRYQTDEKVI